MNFDTHLPNVKPQDDRSGFADVVHASDHTVNIIAAHDPVVICTRVLER